MGATSLDLDNPQQPFEQVAASIREAIAAGELAIGAQLRSVRAMAQEHGVSTGTVQRAINLLRDEGLVTSWQGRGAFVRRKPGKPETSGDEAMIETILDRLGKLEAQVIALQAKFND